MGYTVLGRRYVARMLWHVSIIEPKESSSHDLNPASITLLTKLSGTSYMILEPDGSLIAAYYVRKMKIGFGKS